MIFKGKKNLPSWRIEFPEPAIKNRFFHIDLKGSKIPFDIFCGLLEQLARWGINGVVVEYEHRIPYLPLPKQFPEKERYTENEITRLLKHAQSLGIQWIPLIQTFGHVEYLSRLQGTKNLFENPEYPSQLCPSKKIVKDYLEKLIDYVCTLHAESQYIHVGQDETRQLGMCKRCSERMKESGGKIELYLEHVQSVWEQVFKHNKIPMAWADMFIGNGRLDLVQKIDRRVILIPWDYTSAGNRSKFVIYKGYRPTRKQFYNEYIPEPEQPAAFVKKGQFFEDLEPEEIRRIGIDESTNYPASFAQLKLMTTTGVPLWGACGIYMSADMPIRANYVRGLLNPAHMCDFLIKNQGEGIIGTLWARGHSFAPINAMWALTFYNIVQFARASWTGKVTPDDFRKSAEEIAFELDMPSTFDEHWTLDDILRMISPPKVPNFDIVYNIVEKGNVTGCFGDGLNLSLKAECLRNKIRSIIEEARWWYSTRKEMPSPLKKDMKNRFFSALKEMRVLKKPMKEYYLKWVGDKDSFNLWWDNLFTLDIILARSVLEKFL
ncbi:MAG TPA: family 20 glycosylhydrolase [bacterium]|nr:family 20 glycosylhydrolase [bacterium]